MPDAHWYKNAVFYQVYVRAFRDSNGDGNGDLRGVTEKLDYLQDLGIDCLWLMPIYPSPLKDDGYDIADYTGILPEYGTLDDFRALVKAAHSRGLRVITDMVLNHTSDQHPWFIQARSSRDNPYRDYYVWSDTDQKYLDTRIIFLDTQNSNWSWDETSQQYYWHRFYPSQPDLNYDNPAVRAAMLDVMRFWLDMGVDGFRADAVPYLFEREGTNCENLPETHAYLKDVRAFLDEHYPHAILLGEANQWPEDVRPYFGDGDELHMNFHFPLMPRLYMALRTGDRSAIQWVLERTPSIPENCQWCTFLRNHDELTLEMVTPDEREWMWQQYAPDPRMRLNLGIRRRLAPLLDGDQRKIRLAFSLLFSLPGAPIVYYGDEIGMGDNYLLYDRNGVRTPMHWNASLNGGFSEAPASRLYSSPLDGPEYGLEKVNVEHQRADPVSQWQFIHSLIVLRKRLPVLAGADVLWLATRPQVAAFIRQDQHQKLLAVHNLSGEEQHEALYVGEGSSALTDLLTGRTYPVVAGKLELTLPPYATLWLEEEE